MENASKALVIAGAILISIVLITLGVVILGQGQNVVNNSNMDSEAISAWNKKFTQYEGKNVSGANVNTLINAVISSNNINKRDQNATKTIRIVNGGTSDNDVKVTTDNSFKTYNAGKVEGDTSATGTAIATGCTQYAKPGVMYTVEMNYNGYGYVCVIKITANT